MSESISCCSPSVIATSYPRMENRPTQCISVALATIGLLGLVVAIAGGVALGGCHGLWNAAWLSSWGQTTSIVILLLGGSGSVLMSINIAVIQSTKASSNGSPIHPTNGLVDRTDHPSESNPTTLGLPLSMPLSHLESRKKEGLRPFSMKNNYTCFSFSDMDAERGDLTRLGFPEHLIIEGPPNPDSKKFYVFGISPNELGQSFAGVREDILAFCTEAEEALQNAILPKRTYIPQKNIPLAHIPSVLLENAQGFCLGEGHIFQSQIQFLINSMQDFRKLGVTKLFLEAVFYDSIIQNQLDDYFLDPDPSAEIPLLVRYRMSLGKYAHEHLELIRVAKRETIRIVGIDINLSYNADGSFEDPCIASRMRLIAMNYAATQIIQHEKGEGKFIALMGAAHGSKVEYIDQGLSVPGVADLLGIPFIVILDADIHNPAATSRHACRMRLDEKRLLRNIDHFYFV